MNQSNAQGNESEGVAFSIVEDHGIGLAHLAEEVKKHHGEIQCGQKISKYHGPRFNRKEHHPKKYDRTDGQTDYLGLFLRDIEILDVYQEQQPGAVLVNQKQAGGENEIQDAKKIELYHITYLI